MSSSEENIGRFLDSLAPLIGPDLSGREAKAMRREWGGLTEAHRTFIQVRLMYVQCILLEELVGGVDELAERVDSASVEQLQAVGDLTSNVRDFTQLYAPEEDLPDERPSGPSLTVVPNDEDSDA